MVRIFLDNVGSVCGKCRSKFEPIQPHNTSANISLWKLTRNGNEKKQVCGKGSVN